MYKYVLVLVTMWSVCLGANILMVSPLAPQSHENVFNSVAKLLVSHGHNVTMVLPGFSRVEGVTYISTQNLSERVKSKYLSKSIQSMFSKSDSLSQITVMVMVALKMEKELSMMCLEDTKVSALFSLPRKTFDLVITNARANLCVMPLAHLQNVPLVQLSPSGLFHHTHVALGNPQLPSINPAYYLHFTDNMTFLERLINTVGHLVPYFIMKFFTYPAVDGYISALTPKKIPSIETLMMDTRLVLINTHHSLTYPRAFLPNIVEIGGIHCMPAKPLPHDFQSFVGEKEKGFIFFSLGSTTPSGSLPEEKRNIFLQVFSAIPFQVIWKFDDPAQIKELPPNVKLVTWAPQQDLLGHPEVKLFITQGGLLSVQEATYHGVPILGLPIFGDQHLNTQQIVKKGYGLTLGWDDITVTSLTEAILTITSDERFKRKATVWSKIFRDDLTSPGERALHWIEYILRHEGADFLRSPGRDLMFYQYYLLDVFVFIFLGLYLIYKILRFLCCRWGLKASDSTNLKKDQ